MQRWDYCVLTAVETGEAQRFVIAYLDQVEEPQVSGRMELLAMLGRNGWELVAVQEVGAGLREFYFKRPY